MGLEGLVSKRRDHPYRGGRSKDWVKMKNRSHPAMKCVKDASEALIEIETFTFYAGRL